MSQNVSDHLVQRLTSAWGVNRIYGYPGDGINGIMGALNRAGEPDFIQVRHEEMAAFMACAHAKFTGEAGVCLATSGPGAVHLLNGLYDAKLDHQPVVAIVGQQARTGLGGSYQQEIDLLTLFKDVAHEYVQMATEPAQIRHLVDRAMRIALAERTVTCLIIPNDLQLEDAVPNPPHAHGTVHSSAGYTRPQSLPDETQLERAASILNGGQREGAARQGRGARRPTVRDRLDRPARNKAELGHDAGLRHASNGRLELPLLGVSAGGGQRPGCPD
jgi:pyruvate dehydrogenase (quinone)